MTPIKKRERKEDRRSPPKKLRLQKSTVKDLGPKDGTRVIGGTAQCVNTIVCEDTM